MSADLQLPYHTYVILASIILRDIFPDPDCFCYWTHCNQYKATKLFLYWLNHGYQGLEVLYPKYHKASTREELAVAARVLPVSKEPPNRVQQWAKLIGPRPNISHGGPRYIEQARSCFLLQMAILKKSGFPGAAEVFVPEKTVHMMYTTFGQPILDPKSFSPGLSDNKTHLVHCPDTTHPPITIPPDKWEVTKLVELAKTQERPKRAIVMEFCRLYPNRIPEVITRFGTKSRIEGFWLPSLGFYEDAKLMYQHLFEKLPETVDWLESKLNEKIQHQLDLDIARRDFKLKELNMLNDRIKRAEDILAQGPSSKKIDALDYYRELPGEPKPCSSDFQVKKVKSNYPSSSTLKRRYSEIAPENRSVNVKKKTSEGTACSSSVRDPHAGPGKGKNARKSSTRSRSLLPPQKVEVRGLELNEQEYAVVSGDSDIEILEPELPKESGKQTAQKDSLEPDQSEKQVAPQDASQPDLSKQIDEPMIEDDIQHLNPNDESRSADRATVVREEIDRLQKEAWKRMEATREQKRKKKKKSKKKKSDPFKPTLSTIPEEGESSD